VKFRELFPKHDNAVLPGEYRLVRKAVARAFSDDTELDGPDLSGDLPREDTDRPVLFACCDETYFYRFARNLVLSANHFSPATDVHIHIYNPSRLCLFDVENFARATSERNSFTWHDLVIGADAACKVPAYAASRFIISASLLKRLGRPMVIVDVDGIVRGELNDAIDELSAHDIGFIQRDGHRKLYRKIMAGASYFGNSERGNWFAQRFARAIDLALAAHPQYHIDQLALHHALQIARQRMPEIKIAAMDERLSDHDFGENSLIWSAKGSRKALIQELVEQCSLPDMRRQVSD